MSATANPPGARGTKPSPAGLAPVGPPPADLVIEDLVVDSGAEARLGITVVVHCVGLAWSTGGQFDAS
jgi:peptidylprolyl isomerase